MRRGKKRREKTPLCRFFVNTGGDVARSVLVNTHRGVCRCGDVGGVERVQSSSAAHVQQPGLLLQQEGAVVPGGAIEASAAQQTCRHMTNNKGSSLWCVGFGPGLIV